MDALLGQGVDTIFCVPGESYLAALDACYESQPAVRVIACRHEGAAASMAEAYGKLTGQPGVCFVTRAPGATHASVGVHTASQDSTPLILLVGQVPVSVLGREAFQEADYRHMYASMAKLVQEAGAAARLPELASRAVHTARAGRPPARSCSRCRKTSSLRPSTLQRQSRRDVSHPPPPVRPPRVTWRRHGPCWRGHADHC